MHIGILKETKIPIDRRVALTPEAAVELKRQFPEFEVTVQSSGIRCYTDDEYRNAGIRVSNEISDCDLLVGVKEVSISSLIPGKTYMFFSHTAKKQPYNRKLLQEIVRKQITLVDYEYLTGTRKICGLLHLADGQVLWGPTMVYVRSVCIMVSTG
jgi:saccharopine dehydrogenase (NAD+, L-lysine forming)